MKKILYSAAVIAAMGIASNANAQLVDESNVTITMDLQPILQLNMNGPTNVNFVFDQISEYVGGITQYGVTTLQVSSTVAWDLYAVGYSSSGASFWDNQVTYGGLQDANATTSLPITALELHQNVANPAPGLMTGGNYVDYHTAFTGAGVAATGANCIYANANPYSEPLSQDKYIAGGAILDNVSVVGGSYLINNAGVGATSNYYYVIDYRIVPGLPATFPNAMDNQGGALALVSPNYAKPGVYTMNVKYVLTENQ